MTQRKCMLIRVESRADWPARMSIEEAASLCGIHPQLLDRFICLGLVDPVERGPRDEPVFEADVVPLVRKILRLRNQLGINYAGIGLVLDLFERIERLQHRVNHLEYRLSGWTDSE